jgi:hypothetical protein
MPVLDFGFMDEWTNLKHDYLPKYKFISRNINSWRQTKENNPDILGYMSKPISIEDLLLISNKEFF